MDIILILLIVLCFTILLLLYIVQKPNSTTDLLIIYKKLLKNNPETIAWTFGWIKNRNLYKNVYVNNNENIKKSIFNVKYENYPTSFDGKPLIINNTHGIVKSHNSGFSISGINSDMPFTCPSGYHGPECQQSPLCDATEAGTYKLLSRDQFKSLNLYNYTGYGLHATGNEYSYHRRLRVECLNNTGEFNIEACDDNKLVDPETVQCKIYDLCNDRLDGHKHNFPIAENATLLDDNQYYVCETNKSVLRKCADDTVFSNVKMGCIAQNKCYGLGEKRLVLDNNSYLQCSGDAGHIKHCKYGVGLHYETPYCMVPKCVPRAYNYDDGLLRFITGMVWCDKDEIMHQALCDERTTIKEYRYTWGTQPDVVVRIPNWPRSVFNETTHNCVEPSEDDVLIPDSYVKVRWTNNMKMSYDFDVRTKQFVCQPNDNLLQLDYVNHKLIPDLDITGKFVDYSVPCQTLSAPVPFFDNDAFLPFKNLLSGDASLIHVYRPNGTQFPLIYAIPIGDDVETSDIDTVIFSKQERKQLVGNSEDYSKPVTNKRKKSSENTAKRVMALWPQYHDGFYYTFDYDPKTNSIVYFKSIDAVFGFHPYSANKSKEWDQLPECLQFENFTNNVPLTNHKLLYLFMIDGTVHVPKKRKPSAEKH